MYGRPSGRPVFLLFPGSDTLRQCQICFWYGLDALRQRQICFCTGQMRFTRGRCVFSPEQTRSRQPKLKKKSQKTVDRSFRAVYDNRRVKTCRRQQVPKGASIRSIACRGICSLLNEILTPQFSAGLFLWRNSKKRR
jgi:hypothetical protein